MYLAATLIFTMILTGVLWGTGVVDLDGWIREDDPKNDSEPGGGNGGGNGNGNGGGGGDPGGNTTGSWPMFMHDLNNSGASPAVLFDPADLAVHHAIDMNHTVQSVTIYGIHAYVGMQGYGIAKLDIITGEVLWHFFPPGIDGRTASVFSYPVELDGRLYFGTAKDHTTGEVYCISADDLDGDGIIQGDEIFWSVETGAHFVSPKIVEGLLYIGSDEWEGEWLGGAMYAIDIFRGTVVWEHTAGMYYGTPLTGHTHRDPSTGGSVLSTPAVVGDVLVFSSHSRQGGFLTALNRDSGAIIWIERIDPTTRSSPAVAEVAFGTTLRHVIYIGTVDMDTGAELRAYFLHPTPNQLDGNGNGVPDDEGELWWSVPAPESIHSTPVVAGNIVFAQTQDHVMAVDLRGNPLFQRSFDSGSYSSGGYADGQFLASGLRGITSFDDRGDPLWSQTWNGTNHYSNPAVIEGRVLIGGGSVLFILGST